MEKKFRQMKLVQNEPEWKNLLRLMAWVQKREDKIQGHRKSHNYWKPKHGKILRLDTLELKNAGTGMETDTLRRHKKMQQ